MRLVLFLFILVAGLAAGLGLTTYLIGPGAQHLVRHLQGWEFSPRIGSIEIDPYTRARLFSEGELPLAAGEGYALRAHRDSDGALLNLACSYRLSGPFPPARYWTVTLMDSSGRTLSNPAERSGFTSTEIVRTHEGRFTIEIGPEPLPGNWLPTNKKNAAFEMVLRFYETPLAATATVLDARTMPTLKKIGCPA